MLLLVVLKVQLELLLPVPILLTALVEMLVVLLVVVVAVVVVMMMSWGLKLPWLAVGGRILKTIKSIRPWMPW